MPKVIYKTADEVRSDILFGSGARSLVLKAIARETGISEASLCRYKKNTDNIKLSTLRKIVNAVRLTDAEIVKLVRG